MLGYLFKMSSFPLQGKKIFVFRGLEENGWQDSKMGGEEAGPRLNHLTWHSCIGLRSH